MQKIKLENKYEIGEVIIVPQQISVFTDKRKGVKTVAFPINFPTGVNGIMSITHLDTMAWTPSNDIEKIIIVYK